MALRNTGKREAEILLDLAQKGVHPTELNKQVEKRLAAEINGLWDNHKPGDSTEKIDELQKELTAVRIEINGPIELPDNWCEGDGPWYN